MKQFYLFILALLMIVIPGKAANITLNLDDPARVSVEINGVPYEGELVAGDNAISGCFRVTLKATPGNTLVAVNWVDGYYDITVTDNEALFGTFTEGAVYYVITKSNAESQSEIVKIDVDKASGIRASFNESARFIDLEDGLNEVAYDPEIDKTLKIYSSVSSQMPLYSVTVEDGTATITQTGNVYFVSLPCTGVIKVVSQFPDTECQIDLSYNLEGEGYIKKVTRDTPSGEEVPVIDNSIVVNAGTVLYFHGDTENYLLENYTVNGETITFTDPQRLIVIEDVYVIDFEAYKYPEFNITVSIDNPEAMSACFGSTLYPGSPFELHEGVNTITLNTNKTSILFTPTAPRTFKIESVTINGEEVEPNYKGQYQIADLQSGDNVVITTTEVVRTKKAIVYLNNDEDFYWGLEDASGLELPLVAGYNEIMIADTDNPFAVCNGFGMIYVYVNDEEVEATGFGLQRRYQFSLNEGSVVKIYAGLDEEPEFYSLNFTPDTFDKVTVNADKVTTITMAQGYEVLQGTLIEISPIENYTINVKVNGEEMAADAEGNVSFTVFDNLNVEIEANHILVGIEGISEKNEGNIRIFDLMGRELNSKDAVSLPAGIYVVNGKKVVVK